ncbi:MULTISPECIES: C40 family peptidase [unclassified Acidovorax]|jgi:cell wall-associated NlpC family hydrolase|uniref:C40 family peptidase n=1 Tax=unclassified Acidovorax TaxID=2684926 RepID=UPI000B3F7472|nr:MULTISPECIES: C40 family peptidase [unclassified Acidovorax]MBP3979373.1 C40 family peptidase [Acidovorax sp. JG5]MBU4422991.1 C40 family peptidase [Gammaproteobacteria bacterium]
MRAFPPLACVACAVVLLGLGGCSTPPPSSPSPPAPWRSAASQLSDEQAHDIAIHALGLVGTPYRYGGNTPDSGFDCSGLIGYVYRHRVGTAPPRTVAQLSGWGQQVANGELRSGDMVVFGTGRAPTHAGIYVGEGRFVHAPSSGGTVRLDHLQSRYWSRQNASFRRL